MLPEQRRLHLHGGYNFRDLGGMSTTNGKRIVKNTFIRGDELSNLTDNDLSYLATLPLTSIIDFREAEEAAKRPDLLPPSVKNTYLWSIAPGNFSRDEFNKVTSAKDSERLMHRMYSDMAQDPSVMAIHKNMFELIKDKSKLPVLYHCSAGKDRTGVASALLLIALGVDYNRIIQDYIASNIYLAKKYQALKKATPLLAPTYEVKADYMKGYFTEIEKRHGSMESYLTNQLDVDIDFMRHYYLE